MSLAEARHTIKLAIQMSDARDGTKFPIMVLLHLSNRGHPEAFHFTKFAQALSEFFGFDQWENWLKECKRIPGLINDVNEDTGVPTWEQIDKVLPLNIQEQLQAAVHTQTKHWDEQDKLEIRSPPKPPEHAPPRHLTSGNTGGARRRRSRVNQHNRHGQQSDFGIDTTHDAIPTPEQSELGLGTTYDRAKPTPEQLFWKWKGGNMPAVVYAQPIEPPTPVRVPVRVSSYIAPKIAPKKPHAPIRPADNPIKPAHNQPIKAKKPKQTNPSKPVPATPIDESTPTRHRTPPPNNREAVTTLLNHALTGKRSIHNGEFLNQISVDSLDTFLDGLGDCKDDLWGGRIDEIYQHAIDRGEWSYQAQHCLEMAAETKFGTVSSELQKHINIVAEFFNSLLIDWTNDPKKHVYPKDVVKHVTALLDKGPYPLEDDLRVKKDSSVAEAIATLSKRHTQIITNTFQGDDHWRIAPILNVWAKIFWPTADNRTPAKTKRTQTKSRPSAGRTLFIDNQQCGMCDEIGDCAFRSDRGMCLCAACYQTVEGADDHSGFTNDGPFDVGSSDSSDNEETLAERKRRLDKVNRAAKLAAVKAQPNTKKPSTPNQLRNQRLIMEFSRFDVNSIEDAMTDALKDHLNGIERAYATNKTPKSTMLADLLRGEGEATIFAEYKRQKGRIKYLEGNLVVRYGPIQSNTQRNVIYNTLRKWFPEERMRGLRTVILLQEAIMWIVEVVTSHTLEDLAGYMKRENGWITRK